MDRAERRRQERTARKSQQNAPRTVYVGDNIALTGLGQRFAADDAHGRMPRKQPGKHRWVVMATYTINAEAAESAFDPDKMKLLDMENLIFTAIGCYDCEEPLGEETDARSHCPAGDEWGDDR